MEQMKSDNTRVYNKIEIPNEQKELIFTILEKIIDKIKDPEQFDNTIMNIKKSEVSLFFAYPSICILLGESKELLPKDIDWDEIIYKYMLKIRYRLEQSFSELPTSLFGGSVEIGFGVYALYKSASYYEKFINTLNKEIIKKITPLVKSFKLNLNNMNMRMYDTRAGLSGILGYLLLFKEDINIRKCIKDILECFVLMAKDREFFGRKVPGWYISSENQFLDKEKYLYKKGNFNMGLSHGIAGPLAALSIALNEGVEVEG